MEQADQPQWLTLTQRSPLVSQNAATALTTGDHKTRSYDSAALVAGDERMWNAVSDWVAAVLPGARGGQAAN